MEAIAVKDILTDTFHLIPEADLKLGVDTAMLIIGERANINKLGLLK